MSTNNLSACISQSLKAGVMVPELSKSLLSQNRHEVLHRDENELWDYKEEVDFENPFHVAEFAKDVLGFHNTKGGVIVIGVSNDYKVTGLSQTLILDTNRLLGKIRKYVGPNVSIFQDSIQYSNDRFIWLIFIPRRTGDPQAFAANGPAGKDNKPIISKDKYFMRVNDETRPCVDPGDFARLFSGHSADRLLAYQYELDEPYFRLLSPHCEKFVGREEIITELISALNLRQPVVALDGVGGVGKSAIAIELVSRLYAANKYMFIISLSAKNKIWHRFVGSRMASFSGMTELIQEMAKVMCLPFDTSTDRLKESVIEAIKGMPGLVLIDNIEQIDDSDILRFLSREIPEPVKVLVTSRVDKRLGALTISVPKMTNEDAVELLQHELYKVGYTNFINEEKEIQEIITATGGLPLALKWAAALADNSSSLREVSHTLRQASATKNEFLNFCFATMFDALSPLARDVAILCPYLGDEWNSMTISIALNAQIPHIKDAINELKERGILWTSEMGDEKGLHLLPLTLDFLTNKWHENLAFKDRVKSNLSDALASDGDGLLFNWPNERRLAFLEKRISVLLDKKEYEKAYRLSDLAIAWSNEPDFLFLHGKIDYLRGQISDGIATMRIAAKQISTKGSLHPNDQLFFGRCLMSHGNADDLKRGLILLEDAIALADKVTEPDIADFCKNALALREYGSLRRLLEKSMDVSRQYSVIENIWEALDTGFVIYALGNALTRALRSIAGHEESFNIPKNKLWEKADSISKMLAEKHQ